MKRIAILLLSLAFILITTIPVSGKNYNKNRHRNNHHKNYQNEYYYKHHHAHKYGPRHFNGKRHDYKGHYDYWSQWERYRNGHRKHMRNGKYYHEGGVLMFGFTDLYGNYFYFSIGN